MAHDLATRVHPFAELPYVDDDCVSVTLSASHSLELFQDPAESCGARTGEIRRPDALGGRAFQTPRQRTCPGFLLSGLKGWQTSRAEPPYRFPLAQEHRRMAPREGEYRLGGNPGGCLGELARLFWRPAERHEIGDVRPDRLLHGLRERRNGLGGEHDVYILADGRGAAFPRDCRARTTAPRPAR